MLEGFSKKNNLKHLMYYESFGYVNEAIAREKQLKRWNRTWKNELIETMNPEWNDLSADWEND